MARPSNRDLIVDALQEVVLERGADSVTLDAVAAAAGVSKGGLLYHFGSKAELFCGLLDRCEESVERANAAAPSDPAALVRWHITSALEASDAENRMWRALVGSVHAVDEAFDRRLIELSVRSRAPLEVLDPVLASHVRLVADGLYLGDLVNEPRPDRAHVEAIIESLAAGLA
ncbi:MAG: TetR/AcrR family transcriptional regulator [Actinomycetota bacterium]|nr:TetR/AcrR family transcriptional regulator [Actinomycetota bacterium]